MSSLTDLEFELHMNSANYVIYQFVTLPILPSLTDLLFELYMNSALVNVLPTMSMPI